MDRPQTLAELMASLGGTLAHGSSTISILSVSSPEKAGATDLVFAEDAETARQALDSDAAGLVLKPGLIPLYSPRSSSLAVIEASYPRLWFAHAARLLNLGQTSSGIHPTAFIGTHVVLAENVSVGPGAVIEESASIGQGSRIDAGAIIGPGVTIGDNCHIFPRVAIYHGTSLGNRVVVQAGAVLGGDGFGYVRDNATGAYTQFPQQGTLVIEDDVEIGANSTIDRGALKQTRIGRGTKIDNLVHIGHNCDIGEDVIIVALTGISGSCTVGNGAVIAGQVGIGDHAHIGPGVILGGQAGVLSGKTVTNDGLKPGTVLWGTPARPLKQVLRELAVVARLAKKQRTESKDH